MGSYILCPFSLAILFWEMCILEVYICEKETFNILLTIILRNRPDLIFLFEYIDPYNDFYLSKK